MLGWQVCSRVRGVMPLRAWKERSAVRSIQGRAAHGTPPLCLWAPAVGLSNPYTFNVGVHDVIEENLVELYNLGGLFLF